MSKLLKLTRNTKGIDLFVGDIHGCFTLLEKALEEAGFNKKTDRLICLGDLTDRGPESHRATDFLEESWFISLQGNHDAFVCKTAELMLADDKQMNTSTDVRTCISNGGRWVAMQSDHELKRIVQTFSQLPLAIEYMDEAGNVLAGMVHGEVDYDHTWEEFKAELEKLPHDYVYSLDDDSERAINVAVWGRAKKESFERRGSPADTQDFNTEGVPLLVCGHNIVYVAKKGPIKIGNNRLIDHGICKTDVVYLYTFEELVA